MATMVQNLIMTAALATMVPMAPMAIVIAIGATDRIAIGDNGASIGATYCRHWRQWRQMIHSPNYLTLLPIFAVPLHDWLHS